jgi:hypothetical protein
MQGTRQQGWLEKRGRDGKRAWQSRYFRLERTALFYSGACVRTCVAAWAGRLDWVCAHEWAALCARRRLCVNPGLSRAAPAENETSSSAKTITVVGVAAVDEDKKECEFAVTVDRKGTVRHLRAANRQERDHWITALRTHADDLGGLRKKLLKRKDGAAANDSDATLAEAAKDAAAKFADSFEVFKEMAPELAELVPFPCVKFLVDSIIGICDAHAALKEQSSAVGQLLYNVAVYEEELFQFLENRAHDKKAAKSASDTVSRERFQAVADAMGECRRVADHIRQRGSVGRALLAVADARSLRDAGTRLHEAMLGVVSSEVVRSQRFTLELSEVCVAVRGRASCAATTKLAPCALDRLFCKRSMSRRSSRRCRRCALCVSCA